MEDVIELEDLGDATVETKQLGPGHKIDSVWGLGRIGG